MTKPVDARTDLLPGAIRPVAEICGVEAVVKLVEHFGGTRLYVPASAVSRAIVDKCGEEVAAALRDCFGGNYVMLPLARTLQAARRREAIRNDERPANDIARDYGISVGTVWRLRGGRPGPAALPPPPKRPRPPKPRARDERIIDLEELLAQQPQVSMGGRKSR